MAHKKYWTAVMVGFSLYTTPESARACSCDTPLSPTIELKRAEVVFAGTVIGIEERKLENGGAVFVVKFTLSHIWKGVSGDETRVWTDMYAGGSCGYAFSLGEDYLVYGHTGYYISSELGLPQTTICSRTKPLRGAEEEIEELSQVTAVQPSLWGGIKNFFIWRSGP